VGNQEIPDSPGFGDVDTTIPREDIRAPDGALRAANTAASQASNSHAADSYRESQITHDSYRESRAQASRVTYSGPYSALEEQSYPDASYYNDSPFVIQFGAEVIRSCKSLSELEELQRYCAARPRYVGVVGRMAAAAAQQWREAEASFAAGSETRDNPHQDITADEATSSPRSPEDVATPADTASSTTNRPSIDFRTGAERAYHRSLEQGGPSAKAEGKQPGK
jgi:hypothetical protein